MSYENEIQKSYIYVWVKLCLLGKYFQINFDILTRHIDLCCPLKLSKWFDNKINLHTVLWPTIINKTTHFELPLSFLDKYAI